ncbi:hypothetical protein [Blastochloris viridis]|uniref:Uncharacterized protein n=1 Tax=Blastochloris viridis TaxID=1079 RepID=A0A0H5BI73_BLAVI|nr:hypothetical protein [Blastochloris viridis]ALK09278.1 hypothetical protein BVIR_1496 [Blastochloris viridis]BAS00850.1 hypothetical protein BV133_3256 [Blastochloris viridis]CUU41941.1 hypothetical protein BVIRIDIS_09410 [Blastochloris viridis]
MRALLAFALAALLPASAGPASADWTPVQLGPGGPIIEQDWGLYRPGHGSPRVLDGPILMPVPRPIGMPEPMRRHFEMHYARRGMAWPGMPGSGDDIVRKDTPPSLPGGSRTVERMRLDQRWVEPTWVHFYPGGVEPGDHPKRKPAPTPTPAEPYFRSWSTPTMPDAVQPTPSYDGPDVIIAPEDGPWPRPRR